jgi:hypothetical protein
MPDRLYLAWVPFSFVLMATRSKKSQVSKNYGNVFKTEGLAPGMGSKSVSARFDAAPLTVYCKQKGSTIAERLALFIKVCRAIQYAHQKGIIHRDIKPSSIEGTGFTGCGKTFVRVGMGFSPYNKELKHSAFRP